MEKPKRRKGDENKTDQEIVDGMVDRLSKSKPLPENTIIKDEFQSQF